MTYIRMFLTVSPQGVLGDPEKTTAYITIRANDDPYGRFVIAQESRLVRVDEFDQGNSRLRHWFSLTIS